MVCDSWCERLRRQRMIYRKYKILWNDKMVLVSWLMTMEKCIWNEKKNTANISQTPRRTDGWAQVAQQTWINGIRWKCCLLSHGYIRLHSKHAILIILVEQKRWNYRIFDRLKSNSYYNFRFVTEFRVKYEI